MDVVGWCAAISRIRMDGLALIGWLFSGHQHGCRYDNDAKLLPLSTCQEIDFYDIHRDNILLLLRLSCNYK